MVLLNPWVACWVLTPVKHVGAVCGWYLILGDLGPLSHPLLYLWPLVFSFTQSTDSFVQCVGREHPSVLDLWFVKLMVKYL